jgi:hypothetical protein
MKNIFIVSLVYILMLSFNSSAQEASENFGRTFNAGFGLGYYNYVGHTTPVVHADYEFEVGRNFTLAPFITFYSYQNYLYWGNPHYPYRNYSYRQTVVPIGVKGSYYFDQFLNSGDNWDFYLGASLGFAIRKTTWETGYLGETTVDHGTSGLYLDGHIGTEYHVSEKIGLFLDLSSGISTFGLGVHM